MTLDFKTINEIVDVDDSFKMPAILWASSERNGRKGHFNDFGANLRRILDGLSFMDKVKADAIEWR